MMMLLVAMIPDTVESFRMVMMARRGKGGLKQNLEDTGSTRSNKKRKGAGSLNQGKGQEITGVTLPANGKSFYLI